MDPVAWLLLALPLVALVLLSRRARRQQAAYRGVQESLAPGQQVMTTSGLMGRLVSVSEDVVELRIGESPDHPDSTEGLTVRWARAAIAQVVQDPADVVPDDGAASAATAR